jgi:hypothetical protein
MRVFIGKYPTYWGVYQVCELLKYVGVGETRCHQLGTWMYDKLEDTKFGTWMAHTQRKRRVKIHIHDYDVWNMDTTLAQIILPMLYKIKQDKHGSPIVADADVPDGLKSIMDTTRINAYDIDCYHHDRWQWAIGEMIYAFQSRVDDDWDLQFWTGEKFSSTLDREAAVKAEQRVQRGFELFGKYYSGLWT